MEKASMKSWYRKGILNVHFCPIAVFLPYRTTDAGQHSARSIFYMSWREKGRR